MIAFLFSFVVRLIWVYQFGEIESFKFAGQFMINTNDGYYWAEGARDLLSGVHQKFDLSPIDQAPSLLTYLLAKILPFSFETIIFYMPSILGSLIVIPIILIAHNLKMLDVGLLAALLASIAVSYYNRTMVGYYDTDMLTIVFPVFLVWSLILAFRTKEEKYLLLTALEIIAYRWWYPQSYSLEFAFAGLILLYALVYERKNGFYFQLLSMMLFAMMGLPSLARIVLVVLVYLIIKQKKFFKYTWYLLGLAIILFFVTGGFAPIWGQLKSFVFKDAIDVSRDALSLHFFSVNQTIREAGQIPFSIFAERISGHTITFIVSVIGYLLMVWRYRVMLLGLPLLGLGFLALFGGLRFTIYAVPICAFGIAYLLFTLSAYTQGLFDNPKTGQLIKSLIVILGSLAILYPNILHIIGYRVPTVFTKAEVEILDKLKKITNREDYVVSWWDYGYPIRYYSDTKTLIDGAKHSGDVNFPVSYMLTNTEERASKLARLEVEYTEQGFAKSEANQSVMNNTAQMTLDYGLKDANDFLESLDTNITLPSKTRDIYFYLPFRMLSIFPTVAQFSNVDVMSGKPMREPFFFQSSRFQDSPTALNLGQGVVLEKNRGTIKIGQQEVTIKYFITTGYTKEKKLFKEEKLVNPQGQMSMIYMQAYNTFLVVDEAMLNSSYIQLFVLERYDERFFEPVILEPAVKVYKVKM
ncbi:MAG: STT3 domain-containing protein [Sulfurospirillaceae bacterium]|nr:STT3 domain-containing protein [Sulfurospirillaceae bacterium]MDD2826365.1 STT3 domain-containing protein [Sulfurospirillaceae bacterium]